MANTTKFQSKFHLVMKSGAQTWIPSQFQVLVKLKLTSPKSSRLQQIKTQSQTLTSKGKLPNQDQSVSGQVPKS